ncbi:MAG: hypothetical protein A3F68_07380 [Acidobacteria bacterium RIFCSPLOWO2_12_FULL_54_10]|nr:MAG: hypothetical protein A3F68_07380 [Acidobacteria bacterium RIFCSPLOWO2_12_FULL_54_10]
MIAYLDGRRVRGYVLDFLPTRDRCKVFPSQTAKASEGEVADFRNLKAIFFLKEASAETVTAGLKPMPAAGRRIEVIFPDKERLEGTTQGYSKDRLGFFMVPEDPTGKILRAFIINANVKSVKWL